MSAEVITCEALVVHCIDFRIQRFLNVYLDKRFPGRYDRVAAPGGVKYLVDGGEYGKFELEECGASDRLHHPKMFVLIQHEDCGSYGGSGTFADFARELAFQKEQLKTAQSLLGEQFPIVLVEKFFVRLSGELIPMR